MDANKIHFKSNIEPDFKMEEWSFYFEGMRAHNKNTDQWFRLKISSTKVEAQLYPHGFFWNTIIFGSADMRAFSDAYAEHVLLGDT
jgi:hypothetical protein